MSSEMISAEIATFLDRRELQRLAGERRFARGRHYYLADRVELLRVTDEEIYAEVSGTYVYSVEISRDEQGKLQYACDCPYEGFCKHLVAVFLALGARLKKAETQAPPRKRARVRRLSPWLQYVENLGASASPQVQGWKAFFVLQMKRSHWTLSVHKGYLRKDGSIGKEAALTEAEIENPDIRISDNEVFAISYIFSKTSTPHVLNRHVYYTPSGLVAEMGEDYGHLLSLLSDSLIFLREGPTGRAQARYSHLPGKIEFRTRRQHTKMICEPYLIWEQIDERVSDRHFVLTRNPIWLLRENTLIKIDGLHEPAALIPFTREHFKLEIPRQEFGLFLAGLEQHQEVYQCLKLADEFIADELVAEAVPRLYLREISGSLYVELKFAYGETEVSESPQNSVAYQPAEKRNCVLLIHRDLQAEGRFQALLRESGLVRTDDGSYRTASIDDMQWLLTRLSGLAAEGFEVFGEENLKQLKVRRVTPRISARVSSNIDWFDLELIVDFDGILVSLAEIRKALRNKPPYIKLSDGSTVRIPEKWLQRFRHLLQMSTMERGRLRMSRAQVTMIESLLQEADAWEADEAFVQFRRKLHSFEKIVAHEVPKALQGKLRPYQVAGFNWLCFLRDYNFGGCLADDMGLGKTIQALAILAVEKERNAMRTPSLIVSPTSVVFNWVREIEKFAPSLKVHQQTGNDRPRDAGTFDRFDVILTTFGTLRRDIDFLKDYTFHYAILDESQNIKNPISQTARAVRKLRAQYKLALTGTPLENNTMELWSQMAFLNPGLLGNQKYFRTQFATPIERRSDHETARFLNKLIYPFILRRTKDQVARDLPPKTETLVYAEMAPEQSSLYTHWRDFYRAAILGNIQDQGLAQSHMLILEGLMKLRQIACHPQLIEPDTPRDSGKYEAFLEQLHEIVAEGHKVLVFSQFVRMLTIVRKQLDADQLAYEYLDGQTRDRESRVQRFQENENVKVFLVSLRAGGTGLNLTAADYVIHFDPWWNPAVEIQATDRAHRIGQEKHVFVYKLISKGTVEEKVLQLQERKKRLIDQLITTDRSFFKNLTREDVENLFS